MQSHLAGRRFLSILLTFAVLAFPAAGFCKTSPALGNGAAQAQPAGSPDLLVLANGDRLSGKFVRVVGGDLTFHDDILGDITVPLSKVRELRTETKVAVLNKGISARRRQLPANLPEGSIVLANGMITVQPENNATIPTIPLAPKI